MRQKTLITVWVVLFVGLGVNTASPHSVPTHLNITRRAMEYLQVAFPALFSGCRLPLEAQLLEGTAKEDDLFPIFRPVFHFLPALGDLGFVGSCNSREWGFEGKSCRADPFLFEWSNDHRWDIAVNEAQSAASASSNQGWRELGYVLHLLQDLTSPAHVRNDAHPPLLLPDPVFPNPEFHGDPLEMHDRTPDFPLEPLLEVDSPTGLFTGLQAAVQSMHFSRDSCFALMPGPIESTADENYFYDFSKRKIAHKGRRFVWCKTNPDRCPDPKRAADIDFKIADEQFTPLGKQAVYSSALLIFKFVKAADLVQALCAECGDCSLDSDGDGLPDVEEDDLRCLNVPDCDGDGALDGDDKCPTEGLLVTGKVDDEGCPISDCPDGDDDNDGVCKSVDNCILTPNPDQVDQDSDGFGDACDACKNDGKDVTGKVDGRGCPTSCPDGDDDGDRVCNSVDNCILTPNPDQVDQDKDGFGDPCDACKTEGKDVTGRIDSRGCPIACPDGDDDADGVCNSADNCLTEPNPDQEDQDGDGVGDDCDDCRDEPGPGINKGCPIDTDVGLVISPGTATVPINKKVDLEGRLIKISTGEDLTPPGAVVFWVSSDDAIATVNNLDLDTTGTVAGVAAGTVKISAFFGGLTTQADIEVRCDDLEGEWRGTRKYTFRDRATGSVFREETATLFCSPLNGNSCGVITGACADDRLFNNTSIRVLEDGQFLGRFGGFGLFNGCVGTASFSNGSFSATCSHFTGDVEQSWEINVGKQQ